MNETGPLTGIRVLDFTRVLAGPHCTRMLVDLGADVVKIEPLEGDMTRNGIPRQNSLALSFAQQNCGKRSISIDLRRAIGRQIAMRLAERCDLLVENFRPGVMQRLGLDYDTVAQRNPALIYASISGYGHGVTWSHRAAYAMMVHAETGYTESESRYRGSVQLDQPPYAHGDMYTALECLSAVLAALYHRAATGEGQFVDVSMAETMLSINEYSAVNLSGYQERLPLGTSASPLLKTQCGRTISAPFDPAAEAAFVQWIKAMGRLDLLCDPRFRDETERRKNRQALVDVIQEWVLTFTDLESLENALAAARIPMGVVRSVAETGTLDWAKERNAVVEVSDRSGGHIRLPNSPWRFSRSRTGVRGEPPLHGEHNTEVLREWLGMDEDEIRNLKGIEILRSQKPDSDPLTTPPAD